MATITGRTDRQTDRVRRNMRPPPREEGRIIMLKCGHCSTVHLCSRAVTVLAWDSLQRFKSWFGDLCTIKHVGIGYRVRVIRFVVGQCSLAFSLNYDS